MAVRSEKDSEGRLDSESAIDAIDERVASAESQDGSAGDAHATVGGGAVKLGDGAADPRRMSDEHAVGVAADDAPKKAVTLAAVTTLVRPRPPPATERSTPFVSVKITPMRGHVAGKANAGRVSVVRDP